jgi:hypothetical protein
MSICDGVGQACIGYFERDNVDPSETHTNTCDAFVDYDLPSGNNLFNGFVSKFNAGSIDLDYNNTSGVTRKAYYIAGAMTPTKHTQRPRRDMRRIAQRRNEEYRLHKEWY